MGCEVECLQQNLDDTAYELLGGVILFALWVPSANMFVVKGCVCVC